VPRRCPGFLRVRFSLGRPCLCWDIPGFASTRTPLDISEYTRLIFKFVQRSYLHLPLHTDRCSVGILFLHHRWPELISSISEMPHALRRAETANQHMRMRSKALKSLKRVGAGRALVVACEALLFGCSEVLGFSVAPAASGDTALSPH